MTKIKFSKILSSYISSYILILLINFSLSRNLLVPENYNTIQFALNEAIDNDSILVENGEYFENLIFPNINNIYLIGESQENTIINGNNNGIVITLVNNENLSDQQIIIENFTIKNGSALNDYPIDRGGGIFISNASPTIKKI